MKSVQHIEVLGFIGEGTVLSVIGIKKKKIDGNTDFW